MYTITMPNRRSYYSANIRAVMSPSGYLELSFADTSVTIRTLAVGSKWQWKGSLIHIVAVDGDVSISCPSSDVHESVLRRLLLLHSASTTIGKLAATRFEETDRLTPLHMVESGVFTTDQGSTVTIKGEWALQERREGSGITVFVDSRPLFDIRADCGARAYRRLIGAWRVSVQVGVHTLELVLHRSEDESDCAGRLVSLVQPTLADEGEAEDKATPRSSLATPRASLEPSPRQSLV